ncbi:hypothetical protein CEP52_011582 [Fusarium oligoseptatum]|uniref:F-box domain-containing protein n=1 Tax=Fusarium oligoseptatum TaxID=2604345 RepID=A0A428T2X0_9HYPO|nr:hypothetical protein CEP52_011582 [Fusarium oligoseptatum]
MPPRKCIKRGANPPVEAPAEAPAEAPVEVLVKGQKPFPLLMLPQLALHLIFSYLKPSEMDGISRSSTSLRSLLLPYVFYAVRFEGTAAEVSNQLEAFLYHRRQKFMTPLWESVRCFTVSPRSIRDKPSGVKVMYQLPKRILESLRRTVRVRTVILDFKTLASKTQERFVNSLKASSGWPEVTTLSVTAFCRHTETIAKHWLPGHIDGLSPRDTTDSSSISWNTPMPFGAMKNRAGQLTRMYLGHGLLAIQTKGALSIILEPWVGEKVCKGLEWFVVGYFDTWHKVFPLNILNSVSESQKLDEGIQTLIKTLAMMPRLRRFAFWVERLRLGPSLVRQDWTVDCEPLTSAELDDWYTGMIQKIARSLPKLEQLAIMDRAGTVYMGTRTSEGDEMTVSREAEEVGSQRFPHGIED